MLKDARFAWNLVLDVGYAWLGALTVKSSSLAKEAGERESDDEMIHRMFNTPQ
jgi:hypothetical protein